jgi:hypothetical protein
MIDSGPDHRYGRPRRRRWRRAVVWAVLLPLLGAGCAGKPITFNYPAEEIDFSTRGTATPSVFIDVIRDLRPARQRTGAGILMDVTYPSDEAWESAVVQIYRDALVQDLSQTNLVELVPLLRQADYVLSVDILSLGADLDRNLLNFLLPAAVGFGVGFALGDDSSSSLKYGGVLGVVGMLAIPTPTKHRADAEVRLRLRDADGEEVWERTCLGEVSDSPWLMSTSKDYQKLVDRYLTQAVKRCNACLLGQLRQALIADAR